ncbi:spore coat protein GerQ [Peribacillus cavernae]|uniref:Spore coat protein GerQ n=1 Tax=Peribacillus cavernae TaxID=1674310 RepID=A0A3S0UH50_9BACI|nr:spore coat protein GerQ [Peribacillus cavernae]MDQ0218559.1 spore germination protein Q [Peribacillus cavernae]RUQ31549.1 spore coat protein GerQ [Peribacillus cavernae]
MNQQNSSNNKNPYGNYGYTAPYYPYANVNPAPRQEQTYTQYSPSGYPQNQMQQGGMQGNMQAAPGSQPAPPGSQPSLPGSQVPGMLPAEASYIENILRLNRGKLATVYATFEGNKEWNAKVFKGIIEAAGRDHVILSDPQSGTRYLILMVYLDYVTFDEEIEYDYPYNGGAANLAAYPPR